jgi:hypothetical protein
MPAIWAPPKTPRHCWPDLIGPQTLSAQLSVTGGGDEAGKFIRILRIICLAKLGRMCAAFARLGADVASRKFELPFMIALAGTVLIFGATAPHLLEGELQPDKVGGLPHAMWWQVITLTTIG